jgi:hypothetical protein
MALSATMLVSVSLLIVAVPVLTRVSSSRRSTETSFQSLAALNLAEGGVERAIWELNHGDISTWSGSSEHRTLTIAGVTAANGTNVGSVAIAVSDPAGAQPVIEATGSVAHVGATSVTKTVRVVLREDGSESPFDYGVFGDTGITLFQNAYIDSYNSRNGPYDAARARHRGNIGTNATDWGKVDLGVTLYNNAYVDGSVATGFGSDPNEVIVQRNNAIITGTKSALDRPKDLPSVPPPAGLTFRGNYTLGNGGTGTISQSGQYTNFFLDNNAVVTITASVTLYVTGGFTLSNNTQFRISPGCDVTLYFAGNWAIDNNAQINNVSQNPAQLKIYGTDTLDGQQTFSNNAETYASIYCPRADLYLANNAAIFGSVVSKSIEQKNNGVIHYDESLGSLQTGFGSGSGTYSVKSWQEKF